MEVFYKYVLDGWRVKGCGSSLGIGLVMEMHIIFLQTKSMLGWIYV
jgi:hypothetical protein